VKRIVLLIALLIFGSLVADSALNTDLEKFLHIGDNGSGIVKSIISPENGSFDADEYAIYSSLIKEVYITGRKRNTPILIRDYTDFPELNGATLGKSLKGLQTSTLDDLKAKNVRKFKLIRQFNLCSDYLLVNERANPGVEDILGLSRVGFNADKTQALVHADEIKRWYVSEGYLVLLEKENERWMVKGKEMTYIGE
jgi:hypothetical protein